MILYLVWLLNYNELQTLMFILVLEKLLLN